MVAPAEIKVSKPVSTRGRRSLKSMNQDADQIQIPADEELFKKQYYSIGEVATMFHVNQSLIRYWETEFDILKPKKNRKGDRFFRPVDVKNLVLIYDLLRRRKFTIEGAKEYLKKNKKAEEKFTVIQSLENLKSFLLQLKSEL
ncbi:MAG: MerR family transcriptional regulator [Bacteroidetes bacterium]|nr:MerR family transcriptional regulator [Bacteroidota bacterium]MBS1632367.1 MerR family transcriptional regulator [Bacteroidota bacterium]